MKAKLYTNLHESPAVDYVIFFCPGCGHNHCIPAKRWNFSGDLERPTLSPSVRHFSPARPAEDDLPARAEKTHCHYFLREGRLEYCGDCEHEFAGKTVDLLDVKTD